MEKSEKLINEIISTVEKFGNGKSVPGSGCGCAYHALLDAKMILTHLKLTLKFCSNEIEVDTPVKFEGFKDIISSSFEDLSTLFQEDYVAFEKYRKLCNRIELEKNFKITESLESEQDFVLTQATKTLLKIAKICLELCEMASLVFRKGYNPAKGESGLPMNTLLANTKSCFFIARENLGNLTLNNDTKAIINDIESLNIKHNKLDIEVQKNLKSSTRKSEIKLKLNTIRISAKKREYLTYADIAEVSRSAQKILWEDYNLNSDKEETKKSPLEIFDSAVVLNLIGYQVNIHESLGQHTVNNGTFNIAGLLDRKNKFVSISQKFSPEVQRFTLAHELGHVLLNHYAENGSQIHKDRPLTKLSFGSKLSLIERQANRFASNFLMPQRLVEKKFVELFGTSKFLITEDSAFAMNRINTSKFRLECKNKIGLASILASAEYYNGTNFPSLARQFGVTNIVMAIRLIELDLFHF